MRELSHGTNAMAGERQSPAAEHTEAELSEAERAAANDSVLTDTERLKAADAILTAQEAAGCLLLPTHQHAHSHPSLPRPRRPPAAATTRART